MNRLYIIALAAVGLMSLLAAGISMSAPGAAPQANATTAAAEKEPSTWHETTALTLKRDSSGQFHINAAVNGESVRFLVDTGADMVALTTDEAEMLGLSYGEMQPMMQTASGTGYGAVVTLEEIEVAGVVFNDVEAVVVQDLATNLLGQSVLRQLAAVELKGDKMVIRPR